ncbi:hypothetical protein [Legionella quateirensis]|uniref:hypothetical protein n=1 Tax=Legionella quateirensis TaxID=45072 RepID=UPI0011C071F6|nr:hypothetical protein [Legionella quateirensis]
MNWEILHCVQDDDSLGVKHVTSSGIEIVIPNVMRDLLNRALCLHQEILHCVQDDGSPRSLRSYDNPD